MARTTIVHEVTAVVFLPSLVASQARTFLPTTVFAQQNVNSIEVTECVAVDII